MKILTSTIVAVALLALSAPASATTSTEPKANQSIWLGGNSNFNSWRAVSRDELILWASPSRAYLIKIWRPFSSLRFANAIGVTTTGGRITRFERVLIDGERLPIKSIVALDRETAKNMRWNR